MTITDMNQDVATIPSVAPQSGGFHRLPRLGFLGVGWIGRHRMEAIAAAGVGEIAAIMDPSPENVSAAAMNRTVELVSSYREMLDLDLDGIVIATPSALHAAQALEALDRGLAVFCQKPLGRTASETAEVVEAARRADRLLGVDLSYRFTSALRAVRDVVRNGSIGRVFAAELRFHNAYGPDKPWFYDAGLSGGGCVIDLGTHLIDGALWVLGHPTAGDVSARLYRQGVLCDSGSDVVEDFATAHLEVAGDITLDVACSWKLSVGQDAQISMSFYGTNGGVEMRNIDGSFYDFRAEHFTGTARESLVQPPDEWGGRAAVDWAQRLASGEGFDPEADHLTQLAALIDRIYGR